MTVFKNTKSDAKRLSRTARKGDWLYVIKKIEKRVAKYEDSQLCDRYQVTHDHPLLGGAMCGPTSVEQLLYEHKTVYTSKPRGVRGIWEPSPQVAGPLGDDTERYLDEAEIKGLKKQVRDIDREREKARKKRGWF